MYFLVVSLLATRYRPGILSLLWKTGHGAISIFRSCSRFRYLTSDNLATLLVHLKIATQGPGLAMAGCRMPPVLKPWLSRSFIGVHFSSPQQQNQDDGCIAPIQRVLCGAIWPCRLQVITRPPLPTAAVLGCGPRLITSLRGDPWASRSSPRTFLVLWLPRG